MAGYYKVQATTDGTTQNLYGYDADFKLYRIEGLDPVPQTLSLTDGYNVDGKYFHGVHANERNIVLYILLCGNDPQATRINLYKTLGTGSKTTLTIQTKNRNCTISGWIESNDIDMFSGAVIMQVSIICPYPYFKSTTQNTVTISGGSAVTFTPTCDAPTPFTLSISSSVTIYGIQLYSYNTKRSQSRFFTLNFATAGSSGSYSFSSEDGSEYFKKSSTSLVGFIDYTNTNEWIHLKDGSQSFSIKVKTSSSGTYSLNSNVTGTLTYYERYTGV